MLNPRRLAWPALAAAVLLLAALPAPADPAPAAGVLHPACADAPAVELFAQWDRQLENLAFDNDGNLVVVDLRGDRLLRFDGAGGVPVAVADLPASHGVVYHAGEQRFYATGVVGDMVGPAGIVTFTLPAEGGFSEFTPYSDGHRVANGLAFGPDGALYASDPLATSPSYLNRVGPGGDAAGEAPAPWRDHYGVNGLWTTTRGGVPGMLAAITADQSSVIEFIPFDEAMPIEQVHASTLGAATLQPGVHAPHGEPYLAPKGYDDLTQDSAGAIYAAAHVTGEVLRIDPMTGDACAIAAGLQEPTSLRFAPETFGTHAGDLFVTDMGGVGVTALAGPGAGAVWRIDVAA